MKEGDRVKLLVDVERFPHFVAKAGSTGTICEIKTDKWGYRTIGVKLDEILGGCEEWDNVVYWEQEETQYFHGQVAAIGSYTEALAKDRDKLRVDVRKLTATNERLFKTLRDALALQDNLFAQRSLIKATLKHYQEAK